MHSIESDKQPPSDEKDGERRKNQRTQIFNESINGIKSSLEKLQNYIVKTNADYERRIKESSSVGRKSMDGSTSTR